MKLILFFALLISTQNLLAQISIYGNREGFHYFDEGKDCQLLADNVNVRDTPSKDGKVISNIPIGTAITIKKRSEKTLKINGFESNWYQVAFEDKGTSKTGYIWGGLISEAVITSTADESVQFLYGVASVKEIDRDGYVDTEVKMQFRACKNNKELAKFEFNSEGGLEISHSISNTGDRGLSKVVDLIQFSVSQEMCAGINVDNYIVWNGKELILMASLTPGGDAPYYYTDELIFPEDEGGVKGKIIGNQVSGYFDDELEKDVVESQKKVEYIWTGKALKQTKVLIDIEIDVEAE